MERKYIKEIDILKGIAIFLVTLGHAIITFPVDLHENFYCLALFDFVNSVHMELFFLVSGFCFSLKSSYKQYLKKKTMRLVVPYIVFNLLDMLPRYLLPSLVNRPRDIGDSLYQVLFMGGELWFLYTLFLIFLIFPFLYKLMEKGSTQEVLLLCSVAVLSYFSGSAPGIFLIDKLSYYLLFFTLGVSAKRHGQWLYQHILRYASKWWCLPLLFAWCDLFVLLRYTNLQTIRMLTALTASIFLLLVALTCSSSAVFTQPGRYSLQIYLFNGFLLVPSRIIVCNILGITSPFIIILFNMLVTFLCSFLFIKYVVARFKISRLASGMV